MKRRGAPLLAAAAMVFASHIVATADDFDDAIAAYKSGQPGLAAKMFHALADNGDSDAQFNLALLYSEGSGLPQSQREALYWAWRAHLGGVRRAQVLIARLSAGVSPKISSETADRLAGVLQLQIDLGDSVAMLQLARVLTDLAPEPDAETAYVWQAIAAALGAQGATADRDATLRSMAVGQRIVAQDRVTEVFREWCGKLNEPPTPCDVGR